MERCVPLEGRDAAGIEWLQKWGVVGWVLAFIWHVAACGSPRRARVSESVGRVVRGGGWWFLQLGNGILKGHEDC